MFRVPSSGLKPLTAYRPLPTGFGFRVSLSFALIRVFCVDSRSKFRASHRAPLRMQINCFADLLLINPYLPLSGLGVAAVHARRIERHGHIAVAVQRNDTPLAAGIHQFLVNYHIRRFVQ